MQIAKPVLLACFQPLNRSAFLRLFDNMARMDQMGGQK